MFEQSWRALREHFYDAKLPRRRLGRGPRQVPPAGQARRHEGRPVRPRQPDARRAERLAPGHHRASWPRPEETTADLGLIFDDAYAGPGLKIAEVLKRGPADQRGLNLKAGDVDPGHRRRRARPTRSTCRKLLNDKVGETVRAAGDVQPGGRPDATRRPAPGRDAGGQPRRRSPT